MYRWWPSKEALVADAFISGAEKKLRFCDTGSVWSDLKLQMNNLVRALRGRIVAALIGGGKLNRKLSQAYRERYLEPRRQEARAILQRGLDQGELPPNLNLDLLLDVLYGPIDYRFLMQHNLLTDTLADEVCDLVMGSLDWRRSDVVSP